MSLGLFHCELEHCRLSGTMRQEIKDSIFKHESKLMTLKDSLKVTKLGVGSAKARTSDPTPSPAFAPAPQPEAGPPARGRSRRLRASPPRARLLSMVARARRNGARSRRGQDRRRGGRGRTQAGRGPRRAAGDRGGGGGLPGASREDVLRAPGCPSAPEWRRPPTPQPRCLSGRGRAPAPLLSQVRPASVRRR